MTTETLPGAQLLVASIRAGLINGCRYFNRDFQPLRTEEEVLGAIRNEGLVRTDARGIQQRTTADEQVALIGLEAAARRHDTLYRHSWLGTVWIQARSIDSWNLAVQKSWPGATEHIVAGGAVWTFGRKIVAELRNRNGTEFPREAWLAEP